MQRPSMETRMGDSIMLDTIMEIESIVKAVEQKIISRSQANGLIKNVLAGQPIHPSEKELINYCNQCGKEHICYGMEGE